jgi:ATP-binding cassette subfamily B protein
MGVLLVGVILLIREGISALRQWLLLQQLRSFNSRIVQYFFSRLLQLPMPFFDTRKIGDLTARLNDTTRIQRVVTQIFGTALIEVLLIVVSLIFLFRYSVNIALLTLVFLPFFFGLAYLHRRHVLKRQQQVMQGYALTEANYISTVQGISAIKNHNQQDYFVSLNNQVYGGYQSAILDMGKLQIRISLFVSISSIIFLMLLLTYGSSLVLSGQLKTGELIAIVSLIGSILPGVSGLALLSIPLSEAMVAINRMFEFTSLEIEDERDNEIGTTLMIQSVSIHNLIFRYPGRKPLLKSINLKINRGEMIGLIGENGCGKSTLVQLLLQHYQPETGNVTVNYDKDIHSIPGYIWRKYCSVVPQQVHLFNSSILQNIAFEDAKLNPSEVLAFLDRHGFTPLFKMLPEGINSLVGDEGINLSGGQRQLVGIARALYARPQILILDEATSAMDMETEQFVINLLKKFLPDIGILCITHRLHILKHNCQRIYVMQEGVITINGNHNELMKSANLYSMFWSQMLKEAGDLSI